MFDKFPDEWIETTLGELGQWSSGGTPSRKESKYYGGDIPWVKTGNLCDTLIEEIDENITALGLKNSSAKIFPPKTLLIAMYGATIGKLGILKVPATTNQACGALIAEGTTTDLIPYVFFYLLNSREDLRKIGKGGAQPNISQTLLKDYPIPLPPLNEQRRIVAKIEGLTARSRKAREALDAIPPLLDQFRQSVLAAAFRGDLTADWRAANPDANSRCHQELLSKARSSLKMTKSQGRLWGSGTSSVRVDDAWGEIPESWQWVKVIDLGYDPNEVVQIGPMSMKSNEFTDKGTVVLNVGCIQWHGIELRKCNFLPPERASDFERYRIKEGDVLFTRSGEVGRSAICPPDLDAALMTFHLLRVRTAQDICLSEYLYYAFRGCIGVKTQIEASTIGATRAGFNTKLLQNIWIPLPSVDEQHKILLKIKEWLFVTEVNKTYVDNIESEIEYLDQSILAKAFRGKLVPQDPNDEPASVLLDRIRAEREKAQKPAKVCKGEKNS